MTHPPQSAAPAGTVPSGRLIKVGFADTGNAQRWLGFPELAEVDLDRLLEGLALAASPDVALRLTVRLLEGSPELGFGGDMSEGRAGVPLFVHGTVRDLSGATGTVPFQGRDNIFSEVAD